jgi:hypothetical protein
MRIVFQQPALDLDLTVEHTRVLPEHAPPRSAARPNRAHTFPVSFGSCRTA